MSNGYSDRGSKFDEVEVKKAHAFCLPIGSFIGFTKAGGIVS
jgi:hypothetical protein